MYGSSWMGTSAMGDATLDQADVLVTSPRLWMNQYWHRYRRFS